MKSTAAVLSLASAVLAAGVTESIAPTNSYPSGCSKDYDGEFELTVETVETAAKRDLGINIKRSSTCGNDGILLVTLADGVLTDSKNRTGYIASNYQFQFDDPPQDGAIYTAGFSVCGNDTLAFGASTIWWQCKSGDFWNLYDRNWAAQCDDISLGTISCAADSAGAAGEAGDGQVVGTAQITTTVVQTIGDGQVQAVTTTIPQALCQITDGQAQVRTTACESITTTAAAASETTAVPISQYTDGQIQVTTPASSAAATSIPAVVVSSSESVTPAPSSSEAVTTVPSNATLETTTPTIASSTPTIASSTPSSSVIVTSNAGFLGSSSIAVAVVGLITALLAL